MTPTDSGNNFASLGLCSSLLQAISDKGYTEPSPIQAQAIPAVLSGADVMAAAQTGTGKTAGFTLPILEKLSAGNKAKSNQARALILTPTRELAAQVAESVRDYGTHMNLSSHVVFGGVKINPQMQKLRGGVDILVATPGRLLDLHNQNAVNFSTLEILVLDEADRMLDMGFIHDIRRIIKALPKKRQNLMFSATFSDSIRELAKGIVNQPVEVSVTPSNTTAPKIHQSVYPVDKKRKPLALLQLIREQQPDQVLIFSRTKHGANRLTRDLEKNGILAAAIHGNRSQNQRTKALADFKAGKIQALVATDIAARGLDIRQLPLVINFELPNVPEDYVHRIGRTGRAGADGNAISLVCADEFKELSDIERLIQKLIPRALLEGFEPNIPLPESRLRPPAKPKKGSGIRGEKKHQQKNRRSDSTANGSDKKRSHNSSSARKKNNRKRYDDENQSNNGSRNNNARPVNGNRKHSDNTSTDGRASSSKSGNKIAISDRAATSNGTAANRTATTEARPTHKARANKRTSSKNVWLARD